jgi:hypothetical protein
MALLITSIWTGMAGGFGMYTRQVGVMRAWTAVAVAVATLESGKLLKHHAATHKVKVHTQPSVTAHVGPAAPQPGGTAYH